MTTQDIAINLFRAESVFPLRDNFTLAAEFTSFPSALLFYGWLREHGYNAISLLNTAVLYDNNRCNNRKF